MYRLFQGLFVLYSFFTSRRRAIGDDRTLSVKLWKNNGGGGEKFCTADEYCINDFDIELRSHEATYAMVWQ